MIDEHHACVSRIQYRRNPARPDEDTVRLGYAVESRLQDEWLVVLFARRELGEEEAERLDPLARNLTQDLPGHLAALVSESLPGEGVPGDALQSLANAHPWSLHITAPEVVNLRAVTPEEQKQAQLLDDYAVIVFVADRASEGGAPPESKAGHKAMAEWRPHRQYPVFFPGFAGIDPAA